MPDQVICNTSCLIALSQIDSLELLEALYKTVILPDGVLDEFGDINLANGKVVPVDFPILHVLSDELNLGKGEAQVIDRDGSSLVV